MRIGMRASVAHSMVPRSSGRRRTLGPTNSHNESAPPCVEHSRACRHHTRQGTRDRAQQSDQKGHSALNAAKCTLLWPAWQSARGAPAERMHANRKHADLMHARKIPHKSRATDAAMSPAVPVRLRETLNGGSQGQIGRESAHRMGSTA